MQTTSSQESISSAGMLQARLAANAAASRDFDEWCFRQLPELPLPARVLDLGCGNGKQLVLFSRVFSPACHFTGLDRSAELLAQARQRYQAPPHLTLIEGSFDTLEAYPALEPGTFDLIYASYALYYTQDLTKVLRDVYTLLKPGGVLWVIAPYTGTNAEFLRIIRPLHEVEPFMDYVFDRFHQEVVAQGQSLGYRSLKPSLLRNTIPFGSGQAFMDYLSHSLFYRPGHDAAISAAVQAICDQEGVFKVSKNIISLQLRK
ncbi:MAG: methyltransferase domain-containing protein [Bacteroidia bacterium]|nr:methyltransferase domain-containing protein [Bacteroidia bacterium]